MRGSGEDVLREDNRGAGAEAGHDGSSACCHDDMIGMQGADGVGVGLRVQADIDPGAGKHGGEICAERGEHALPGRQGGNVGKTAERGGGLEQHNLVPALRGGEGGFAPGGSAADDNDGLRRVGLRHGVVILISGARVQGAGDGAAFVEHPGAAFVAADAGQDLVVAAFRELGGQEGIGEQGPAHGHQIGLAGSDDVFGGLAVADPAHHGDGYAGADGPLDRGGAIGVPAVRHAGGGNDVFHGLTDADGDVQHVHAVVGHDLGDADGLFHVDAAGHEFFHAVAEKDGEIGADLFSDGAQDFEREAHPVFKAAAVGILAEVGERRHELVDEVAVRPVDFHGVEPGFHGAAGGLYIRLDHAFDVVGVHDAGVFGGGEARNHGDEQARTAGGGRVAEAPAVLELNGDLPVVAMHGVGELGEALDHEVVGNAETEIKAVAAAGHIGGFDDIHAYAALGALLMVPDEFFGGLAVDGRMVRSHCGHDDAVFQRHPVDPNGGEKNGTGHTAALSIAGRGPRQVYEGKAMCLFIYNANSFSMRQFVPKRESLFAKNWLEG